MASELVRELVNAGIHFGHRVSRWNPKMKPYIFGRRNLIHIIDIRETVKGLLRAKKFLAQVVSRGDDVLFVGTKRQARHTVTTVAGEVGMPYVARRWLGGTLTNFRTIRSRLTRLEELEAIAGDGRLEEYSKKAIAMHNRELRKIKANLEGIRNMDRLPGVLLVIDARREHLAVREAKKLGIPTICLLDTDSDPDFADIPIPGNDDSMRSIETILKHLAEAIAEGKRARKAAPPKDDSKGPGGKRRSKREAMGQAGDEASEKPAAPADQAPASTKEQAATDKPEPVAPAAPAADVASDGVPATPATPAAPAQDASQPSEAPAIPETT